MTYTASALFRKALPLKNGFTVLHYTNCTYDLIMMKLDKISPFLNVYKSTTSARQSYGCSGWKYIVDFCLQVCYGTIYVYTNFLRNQTVQFFRHKTILWGLETSLRSQSFCLLPTIYGQSGSKSTNNLIDTSTKINHSI